MNNRRQALSRARQYRTCPPPGIAAENRNNAEKMKRHLAVCPYCAGQDKDTSAPWEELTARLSQPAIRQPAEEKPVAAGCLYYVKQEKACWRGDYYYNPPLVLVMEVLPDMADAVHVAQTYHELCLAGPGDLILRNDQTGCGDLFVECWHTYTLRAHDLGPQVGKVSGEVLQAVSAAGENLENMPDWAPLTRPLADQDPRVYFRELEVECGFTFGAPAVAGLLQQFEGPRIGLAYRDAADLKIGLVEKTSCLHWSVEPETIEQVLALARYPDEMLPMAADTAGIRCFQVNLVYIRQGRVERMLPLVAEILAEKKTKSRVTISGRIRDLPEDARESDLLVFWPDHNGRLLQPLKLDWSPSGADFFMIFAKARRMSDAPAMAMVCDSDKGR